MQLDARVRDDLLATFDRLTRDGQIVASTKLPAFYATFRQRFGPQVLASLDGEALLAMLKPASTKDNLAYWLEFKNDEEFPAIFGGIAGGSALKWGVYWRNEAGSWMTGTNIHQKQISEVEAIAIARRDRDQLLAGAQLIDALPLLAPDEAYRQLQFELNKVAPHVQDTAWGHKYFCLLFPEKVSDIHVVWHQQLQLIRLLEIPPKPIGRYVCEGRYVAMAHELDLPIYTTTTAIYHRNGPLRRYWRVDIAAGMFHAEFWDVMRSESCVAAGWLGVGDLSDLPVGNAAAKEELRQRVLAHDGPADSASRIQQLMNLARAMNEGDCVIVTDDNKALGIGSIAGPYAFAQESSLPHRRTVKWQNLDTWQFPRPQSAKRSIDEIDYAVDAVSLVEIERQLLSLGGVIPDIAPPIVKNGPITPPPLLPLSGIPARIQDALERKGQVIVYGPPGTGKTYWAIRAARELAARSHFGISFDGLAADQQAALLGNSVQTAPAIRLCTFHPGYGYEDFIEGYRPASQNGQMVFEQRPGIFKQLCTDAASHPDRRFYLLIDEINRGDVPRIFGELLTLLEKDKRGLPVILSSSGHHFHVPDNVFVIGTMNTADRSIALLDTALRRRFAFVELMPDFQVLGDTVVAGIPLGPWLQALNERIRAHIGRDARNLQIGHAYLLDHGQPLASFASFTRALRDDIFPLLEEYCYENYAALAQILGSGLVDVDQQRFREQLFDLTRHDDLVQALLEPSPDIMASPQAVQAGTNDEPVTDEGSDGDTEAGV